MAGDVVPPVLTSAPDGDEKSVSCPGKVSPVLTDMLKLNSWANSYVRTI
jgi:hypothetical protein